MRPSRTKAPRLNHRQSRAAAVRRRILAIGLFLALGGCAVFALSMLAVVSEPDALAVPAMGSLAMIGALVALAGVFCLTSSEA